jgi:GNAT superfamily N-acetyltransferase
MSEAVNAKSSQEMSYVRDLAYYCVMAMGYRPSIQYGFIRSRQLEETFPGDKETGVWPITSHRISYGWGDPPEEYWPYPKPDAAWPGPERAGIDAIAKKYRIAPPYRRVRDIPACIQIIRSGRPVTASLDITDKWANPPEGRIPAPSPQDIKLPTSHHVTLVNYDPASDEFKFHNSWGLWGDNGYGYIKSGILAATWWEGWTIVSSLPVNSEPRGVFPHPRAWEFDEVDGSKLHWLELVNEADDRIAWVSAVQSTRSFEVEELFVRPPFRRSGHGKNLFRTMHAMAESKGLLFRMWVSFADTSPQNLEIIDRLARPFGLSIRPSGKRWARFVLAPVWSRSESAQTFEYPEKPPSVPNQLVQLASDLAIGVAGGLVSNFLYEAVKSWLKPNSGKKIRATLGDAELETSEIAPAEFRKLFKDLQKAKSESEIRSAILQNGISVTIVDAREKKTGE